MQVTGEGGEGSGEKEKWGAVIVIAIDFQICIWVKQVEPNGQLAWRRSKCGMTSS